jgi:hypothetical protein
MIFLSSRRPVFWLLLSLVSLSGIVFTYKFFTRAFPIASLDLKVDRKQVLAHAHELAQKYQWGPQGYRQAASFDVDSDTKNYVELEAGGSQAFNQMITGSLYTPYEWQVRHFKEGETNETLVSFKPDGTPYEFLEKIAESTPGEKISPAHARTIAEESATQDWGIDFSEYSPVESSQEVRPNGRADHTFVYERPMLLGEARYRLRLTVTGDKFTELNHFMKIPEGFFLRYAEMRSFNKTISTAARIAMNILYILLGCCIGLFLLMRQGWVLWKHALVWAGILAVFQFLTSLNELPQSWMSYDTALSASNFLLQYNIGSLINALFTLFLFFLSFAAAESLTRKAFGDQIQFWKLWTPMVANSFPVLGRTIGGYLIVGSDLALVVATYIIARTFFGWWLPSDTLVDPNILASYVPWLSPATRSLSAGFWEECLFRAVPLASAALIGQRFGKRKLFLVIGFIVQAVVFGAGHADYPTQPSYGRLLELILPSFIFGGIYLVYGLLPGIISHFIFDLVLMSMPLFISSAPGVWMNQGAVILWGGVPLLIVLYFRYRLRAWHPITLKDYNNAWRPSAQNTTTPQASAAPLFSVTTKQIRIVYGVGIAALLLWVFTTQFKQDAPAMQITGAQASTIARQALSEKNLDDSWLALPFVFETIDPNNRYVWQEGGKEMYQTLISTFYVPTPQWIVRFAKFNGPLEDRAEEYALFIAHDGTLVRISHRLPEKQSGASLTEEHAWKLGYEELLQRFGLEKEQLKEVSATPTKHPNRLDWALVFTNLQGPQFKDGNGQLRISVTISGNEITDVRRFVHVPEEWLRNDRNTQSLLAIIKLLAGFLLMFLVGIAALYALISFNFSVRELLYLFGFLLLVGVINFINGWPGIISRFVTSDPWATQVFRVIAGISVSLIIANLAIGFVISMIHRHKNHTRADYKNIFAAIFVGILFGATSSLLKVSSLAPTWAVYTFAGTYLPLLATLLSSITGLLFESATLLAMLIIVQLLSASWTKNKPFCYSIIVTMGLLITSGTIDSVALWLVKGILIGFILLLYYATILRSFPSLIIITLATSLILRILQQMMFAAYAGALVGNILGIGIVIGLAWYLYKKMNE